MRTKLIALFAVAVVLAGTGIYALASLNKDSTDRAIELVPEDAFFYAHVFVKPSVNQRKALRGLLDRFPKAPDADEALDPFFELIDEGLKQYDMTYKNDIKPWLGDQLAFFMTSAESGGGFVAVQDVGAAQEFLDVITEVEGTVTTQGSYEGIDYVTLEGEGAGYAFVDDFLVFAPEEDLKAVIDVREGAGSLDGSADYKNIEAQIEPDRIFSMYLNFEGIGELVGANQVPGFAGSTDPLSDLGSAMFSGHLRDDAAVIELASERGDVPIPTGLVDLGSGTPADAWLALGSAGLGQTIEASLESLGGAGGTSPDALLGMFTAQTGFDLRDDFLAWMEDLKLYARGTGLLDLGGAVSIGSSDPETSTKTVERLLALAETEGIISQPVEIAGIGSYAIQIPGSPQPIIVVPGDRVVIAYGEEATEDALDPEEPLATSERFAGAMDRLGAGFDPYLYLDVDSVQALVENFIPPTDLYVDQVKPWLDPIAHVISGSKFSDDFFLVRFVIGVE